MRHTDEKGTKVNRTEHRTQKKLFATTGLRVTLHALRDARGNAQLVSPRARRYKLGAALSVAVGAAYIVAVLLFFAAPALAGGLPQAQIQILESEPYSTRLNVQSEVKAEGSSTKWALEISTSPSGPWSTLQSETFEPGLGDGGTSGVYHHLSPGTRYYLQLIATNASGTTTQTHIFYDGDGVSQERDYPEYFSDSWFATTPVRRPEVNGLGDCGLKETSVECHVEEVETNGAQTVYHFEYSLPEGGHAPVESSPSWKPFTSGAEDTITVAEDFAGSSANLTGLTPETTYYVRVKAENEKGESSAIERIETRTAKPSVFSPEASNVTSTSAKLEGEFQADGYETEYRVEYTTEPDNFASWVPAPGGSGTIAAADATEEYRRATANLTGLTPATTYFIRLFAKSSKGEETSVVHSFTTTGPPSATTFAVHALGGATVHVLGSVTPNGSSTDEEQSVTVGGGATGGTFTLSFDGETTAPIPYITHTTANQESEAYRVVSALRALPSIGEGNLSVRENFATSSYTVEFDGALAGRNLSQLTADASGLTPSGTVTVATVQKGEPFDSRYHFEYTTGDFAGCGTSANPACVTAPEGDLGASEHTEIVGAELPGLRPGATYHFRITATNSTLGDPVVDGAEQTLTVPTPAAAEAQAPCPNEALRVGPSAKLPDCRAYEQVTPTGKRGAMDFDRYGANQDDGALPGYDGDHVSVHAPGVDWGSSPDAKEANYLFSRTETGWRMASLTPQPGAGLNTYLPAIFSPDLTQVAVEVGWTTGPSDSPDVDLMAGPPGGPYATVASIPRSSISNTGSFVAASADSSKYVFQTEDHKLLGQSTGTLSGDDLYEFSAEEGLRQVNVQGGSPGTRISTCGAQVVAGLQAVSADGSRVFFTDNCTHDLYMRVGGAETVDIGEYEFLAGNAEDSELLLGKGSGEEQEVFLYDTEARTAKLLPGAAPGKVSEDLSTIYFSSSEQLTPEAPQGMRGLYRYEVASETTHFVLPIGLGSLSLSPDGRYLYISAESIPGVPGGAPGTRQQIYRLDTVEDVIECISCASSFDPEPKLSAFLAGEEVTGGNTVHGALERVSASANGDYIFFDTPAALVPADVDGEIAPNVGAGDKYEYLSGQEVYSPSSDVYEWRANGVGGCGAVQGCLSLITTGQGNGLRNVLYGTDASGRDVFFGTHESLVASDDDTAGDIYDARVDGGFPLPPPGAVECEGDACSTPANPPNDVTPSSFTFAGAGNLAQPLPTKSGNGGSRESGKHKSRKQGGKHRPRKQGSRGKRAARTGAKKRSHAKSSRRIK